MINLVTIYPHTKSLQYYWPYSYIISLWIIYFVIKGLYLLIPLTFFRQPSTLLFSNHSFVFCIYESVFILFCLVLDSICMWDHMVFVFLWLISLSITPSRSIHVVTNGKISFFNDWITFYILHIYTYMPHLLHLFIYHEHLGCFIIFATVNNDAVNIGVMISFQLNVFVVFG